LLIPIYILTENSIINSNTLTTPEISATPVFSGYINSSSAATAISTFTPISDLTSSINTPLSRSNNNSSTPTSGSTIRSDVLFAEVNEIKLSKNLDDFIFEVLSQLRLDYFVPETSIIITVQDTIDVVNDMINWIKDASEIDLLKKPVIRVTNER